MALFIAGFGVCAFAVGSETLLRIQANRATAVRAEIFTAALALCDRGDFSEAAMRLEAQTDRLVAVATLDESGALREVCPNLPEHRDLAIRALDSLGKEFTVDVPGGGTPVDVVGVIVNHSGGESASPSRALLVMRFTSYRAAWLKALAIVTMAVGAIALLRLWTLNRWFERQVARPLREIAGLRLDPNAARSQMPAVETGDLQETRQIAQQMESLLRNFADADSRTRKVEQETRRQILHRELGFDVKLKRAKDEATTDPLTRLRNRAFLDAELESVFNRQREQGAPLSAVMIDVDNFKRYNDAYGHQVGDMLLSFVGSLLRSGIRPTDYAIRYGGDEFLLLLPDTGAQSAATISERLLRLFGQHVGKEGKECGVSMSAGVASIPDDKCESGHMLVARADAALYAAKFDGKNTVALSSGSSSRPDKGGPTSFVASPVAAQHGL
jgi:diguanylate cyclase (GGDEF)-like protein